MEYRRQVMHEAQGAKVLGISARKVAEFTFSAPTLLEQRKIASFLGAIDEKIAHLSRKKALLEDYKKGCMQQLFSQKIRFKHNECDAFPDWAEKRLEEVFTERSERNNANFELLSVTLNRGVVRAADIDRATSASADRSNYKTVMAGDLAYNSMRMWQGASGSSSLNGIVSPAYTVLIPHSGQISGFWAYYFKLTAVIHIFERYSQGLTSDTWNLKFPALSKIKLSVPHPTEQLKISDFLTAIDRKIELVAKEHRQAETFKRGLLQQMIV
jgi:type I restriction enzyme S subunit